MKTCGVKIAEGLNADEPLLCELPAGHPEEKHACASALKARIARLEETIAKLAKSDAGRIVYRATVRGVSTVDVRLKVAPAHDGEEPFTIDDHEDVLVNIPGAANAEDVEAVQRAFGAIFGIEGAVRITVEVDPR